MKDSNGSLYYRQQYFHLGAISLVATLLTGGTLFWFGPASFRPYLGLLPPMLAIGIAVGLAFGLFHFLLRRSHFVVYRRETLLPGLALASVVAIGLALVATRLDLAIGFPRDMNVAFPESLLFYPAIGFIVEVIFHLLPLAMLLFFFQKWRYDRVVGVAVLTIPFLEAVMQGWFLAAEGYPSGAVAAVGLHLYIINLVQLWLFRRFDFVTMYGFRLVYYLCWHILWGHWRLEWLF